MSPPVIVVKKSLLRGVLEAALIAVVGLIAAVVVWPWGRRGTRAS